MVPHAKACFDEWSSVLVKRPDAGVVLWHVLGHLCERQGASAQAIGCFELSRHYRFDEEMNTRERIEIGLSLSSILQKTGRLEESSRVLADINTDSLDQALGFRVALAKAFDATVRGHLTNARYQYKRLQCEQEAALGPTDPETVSTIRLRANVNKRLGRLDEAQALHRRVYLSLKRMYGQNDRLTMQALDDLADICKASSATDVAEGLYKQAVDLHTRTLGAGHPRTACAIQQSAIMDRLRGRYFRAEEKHRCALDILTSIVGKAHPFCMEVSEALALSIREHAQSLAKKPTARPAASHTCSQHIRSSSKSNSKANCNSQSVPQRVSETDMRREVLRADMSRRLLDQEEQLYLDRLAIHHGQSTREHGDVSDTRDV
ncbi:hypothetical protein E4U54_000409 [Claviceps lovelessii]|nr:hypothetical protein E4U54_000409 [Claviceps lovelessii]